MQSGLILQRIFDVAFMTQGRIDRVMMAIVPEPFTAHRLSVAVGEGGGRTEMILHIAHRCGKGF